MMGGMSVGGIKRERQFVGMFRLFFKIGQEVGGWRV